MPTLLQKIRLVIRGWNRRREERQREFLTRNSGWGSTPLPNPAATRAGTPAQRVDLEGLTVAYLDDSGQTAYYLEIESGDVVEDHDGRLRDPGRYRRVPVRTAQSEIDDRRAFIASLDPSPACERLSACVGVPEAFRRALAADRKIERAWYSFKNDRAIRVIEEWLRSEAPTE